jgi:hypothetical protein
MTTREDKYELTTQAFDNIVNTSWEAAKAYDSKYFVTNVRGLAWVATIQIELNKLEKLLR